MKKTKALRVEMPEELYLRFKKCAEEDYSNVTTLTRSLIVDYVRGSEFRPDNVKDRGGNRGEK